MYEDLAIIGLIAGIGAVVGVLVGVIMYVYFALVLQTLGTKLKSKEPVWMAWVPLVNLYYLVRLAGFPGWYVLAFLLPVIPFLGALALAAFIVWTWWRIAESRKFPGWLGILMLIPIVNVIIPGVIAWTEK